MQITCPKCGATDELDLTDVPPGKAILRCEQCNANFEVLIKGCDVPNAQYESSENRLIVTCPLCHKELITTHDAVARMEFWKCPSCSGIFRVGDENMPETTENTIEMQQEHPANLITEPHISADELDELEAQLTAMQEKPEEVELDEDDIGEMLPPLPEKDRFTAQFIVKVAGAELGPISFNVLEDWARSGMIPKDALVSKADESRFHRADRMPELLEVFEASSNAPPGKGLRDILKEETAGVAIAHGAGAGAIGGIITGILTAMVVLVGVFSIMPAFPAVLQAIIAAGVLTVVGAGIGAMSAAIGQWIIDYPWTVQVQAIIGFVFGIGMFAFAMISGNTLNAALAASAAAFAIAFLAGYIGVQFHHILFEKVE